VLGRKFDIIESKPRGTVHTSLPDLKLAISQVIHELNSTEWDKVQKALKQWPGRLQRCIDAEGGHFEH
jgi:hypothetical protein